MNDAREENEIIDEFVLQDTAPATVELLTSCLSLLTLITPDYQIKLQVCKL